ncbi:PAS domain S-box protein [Halohasta salina]|uniref:PAS domain S-box protein n=1 Tax=Halohasta salina TaxID=2961621 RepID=UPI0020A56F61|nr:PAS domain S-box protein [Halohasta salina]
MSADSRIHALGETSTERVLGRVEEAICAFDDDWQITFVNDQAATMLDHTPDELLGEDLWEMVPDITETVVGEQVQEAMSTGTPTRFERYDKERDRWFETRIYPDSEGATACFDDITDERGTQLDIQRQRRLFETVFEETEDALVVADTDRRITDFNPAAEQLFGYDASDVLGERTRLLYADNDEYDRQGDQRFNKDAPMREETYRVEYERADGTTFVGETLGTSLKGPDGETLAFLGSVRDVSARIEYEETLEAHNDALQTFHDISTDDDRSVDERIGAVLELGCEHLGLDIGILSAIEDTEYTVEQVDASDDSIRPGEQFDLGETFCEFVVDSEELVAVTDAGNSELGDHPAYRTQGLESYIGTPVVVDGERYGTLNFSQAAARKQPFTESERTLVRLFAQWVGKELSRHQNKQRAAANRDRLRQIIDLLPQLVFAKDRHNEYILANQAIADAYGTTVDDVEGSTDADFVSSAAEAEQFRQDDLAVMDSGEPKHIPEEPLTKADGETVMLQTIKIPYDPVDHDTEAVLGVATDITEMTEQRRELEETSQRLNVALEATNAGVWELNLETKEVAWTDSMEQLFGLDPDASDGSYAEFIDLVHPDDIPAVQDSIETATEDGDTLQVEYRIKQEDGTYMWVEARAELLAGENTARRLVGIATDITDRKERTAEIELQSAAMEVAMDGIAILDDDEYVYMNQAHADIFDYDPEELLGREWRDLYADEEIERLEAEVFPALADTGSWRGETIGKKRDGTPVTQDLGLALLDSGELICTNRDITAQKQREQELQQQRSRIRALFDNSPDGIVIHDADGTVLDINETIADSLGYDRETLMSMNVAEFEAGIDRSELVSIWAGIEPNDTLKVEGEHRRQNGETYPVEVWVNKVEVGGNDRYIAVARDITERKQREAELKRSREFIEAAQESAAIGGWEVDLETDSLRWTDEVYRIHEIPTDTSVELEDGLDFYHPDDRPEIEAAFERLVEHGESYDLELRIVTADDRVRWVRAVGDPQFDEDGTVVGALGVFQDITERREREAELRELKERLDLAVEGANLGVWDWDVETDAVTFNDQWASMLGFSLDDIEPRLETWENRVHPADMDDIEAAFQAHMAGETELYDSEHRMQAKGGEWRWIRSVGKIVDRADDGTPQRAVGIHLDITEEKKSKLHLEEERDMFAEGPAVVFKWEHDEGWPVEYVSENVTETFGYTPKQLRSGDVPYTDLIHDDDRDRVIGEVREASEGSMDRFTHDPYRMVTRDGEIRWVTDNTKVIRTEEEITHLLGYLIDITEQKRLEASLRESEQSLRELTTIASDTDREFEAKLSALLELGSQRLGLPYGFLNRIDDDTVHVMQAIGDHPGIQMGASAPLSESYCRKTIQQSTPLAIRDAAAEGWEGDPADERFDLGCYIGGTVTVDGDRYGTLCFADSHSRDHEFDPSERAFVELLVQWISHELSTEAFETKLHEINETAQQLMAVPSNAQIASLTVESARAILETPMVGVWWYDDDRDVLVPEGATSAPDEPIPEQPVFERGTALAWEAFDAGELREYDDLKTVDGLHNEETIFNSEVIVPLGDHGVMCAASVEPRAFSETDLNLLEVLSSTVEAALARAERETVLRETQAELKQSNEELEQFAYAASHDLQEPLRTVSSYLTLLERRYGEDLDGDATEFIEFAVDGADRMRNMIQALLAYSRVDTRGESFEAVELSGLFKRVTDSLGVKIAETDAAVSTPTTEATVMGDPSQLAQLFQNLIDNGIKYNRGHPEVDISVRSHDGMVTVDVSDNGIGIEADQRDGIFEVFQRLHTREEFDGTGIGLSICRKIVDRHGGDIEVNSQPGEGSTFTIMLPEGGGIDG